MRTPTPWADVFMGMARQIAKRSKDPSARHGAVLVDRDNRVLGSGFNGPPPLVDDREVPWLVRPAKYDYIIHAEENALWFALEAHGAGRVSDSVLYCTCFPCPACTLRIVRAGVGLVVYDPAGTAVCVDEAAVRRSRELLRVTCYPLAFKPYRGPNG